MTHRSSRDAVEDLRTGRYVIQIDREVVANLEMAEIQRRRDTNHSPAPLFTNLRGCRFPAVSNLFDSIQRASCRIGGSLEVVRRVIEVKIDPSALPKKPFRFPGVPRTSLNMLPRKAARGPVQKSTRTIKILPAKKCWSDHGDVCVTLPQVRIDNPNTLSNPVQVKPDMHRVQLAGNDDDPNREVGLHCQIHRGMGIHHQAGLDRGKPLCGVRTVGRSPARSVAEVMLLFEDLMKLTFGGALAGRKNAMITGNRGPLSRNIGFAVDHA